MIKIKRSQPKLRKESELSDFLPDNDSPGGIGMIKNRQTAQDRVAEVDFQIPARKWCSRL